MPPVFNRFIPNPHPYDTPLSELVSSGGMPAALARNIQWDHRVSPERERDFDRHVIPAMQDKLRMENALRGYFKTEIRERRYPAFLDSEKNGLNIVHGGTNNLENFAAGRELVNIIDLNQLGSEYAKGWPGFEDFDPSFEDVQRLEWLDARLNGKSFTEQLVFLSAVFQRLSKSREKDAFQPVWVTFWDDFEPFYEEGPDRWCEILGIPKITDRVWLVVLRYTVADACTLVRPTQLDAGWFGSHFPSPPERKAVEGGCAMDLQIANDQSISHEILPELIHPQIDFKESFIEKIGCTTRPTIGNGSLLQERRVQHRSRLAQKYAIANWMISII